MNTTKLACKRKTLIVAHRGVSGLEPENTAAAFIAAGNRTQYGIETDIWDTKDGYYLCNHDGRTGRIADVDLDIQENTFADLRAIKLHDIDDVSDRGELILPLFAEYIKICKKYGKIAVPELKPIFTREQIREITDIVKSFDYLDSTCFISFEMDNLDRIKEIYPDQECQYLTGVWEDELPEMLAARKMGLDIAFRQLTEERVAACHAKGVEVNCWTIDDTENAERMISWGVDYITSNILE